MNLEGSHRLHGKAASERKGKILPLGEEQKRVVGETKLSPKILYLPSSKKVASTALASNERATVVEGKRIIVYIAVSCRDEKGSIIEWKIAAEEIK
jgi:hypothetical protein